MSTDVGREWNEDPENFTEYSDLGWSSIGILPVRSGRVWVGDAQFAAFEIDGEIIDLAPGEYEGQVRHVAIHGVTYASHFRVVRLGANPERGPVIGETWADTASQGVCDFEVYRKISDRETYWEEAEEALTGDQPGRFVHEADEDAVLLHTDSGFGDGRFNLYELVDAEGRKGIEVEMISLNHATAI